MSKLSVALRRPLDELARTLTSFDHRHRIDQVFFDWLEMSALAISNRCDLMQYQQREARYMTIVAGYSRDEARKMAEMLGSLAKALAYEDSDCPLSTLMTRLELGSKAMKGRLGQFYTPFHVSYMMAQMVLAPRDQLAEEIKEKGYLTMQEPACGAGGMVLAFARAFEERGFSVKNQLYVTAIDIDPAAVHMTYLQASLRGIPAVVFHGDTLRGTTTANWLTPAYVAGRWDLRLKGETPRIVPGIARWKIVSDDQAMQI
jgi:methylase of polypeptide subunit release factors